MKLTYLGTAAAEGFPAVFCNCKYCQEARKIGGKNIRTRSQAVINDDLLVDFPADTYSHFLKNGIEGDLIKYLLVTHSHSDHFYSNELKLHNGVYAHDMRSEELQIYCSKGTFDKFAELGNSAKGVSATLLSAYSPVVIGDYTVTALPAKHFIGDGAFFYMIQGEKNILYAHDTGYFYDEVFEFLQKSGTVIDLISLDCTCVDIEIDDDGTHMGIANIERVVKRLTDMGSVTENTIIVINHFSHNGNPLQHVLEERVAHLGYIVAYDGLSIEI